NGGAAAAVRPAGQRANQDEEDQGLSGDRGETGKGGLEETISMTSQDKCAINFSTGFGTQPNSLSFDSRSIRSKNAFFQNNQGAGQSIRLFAEKYATKNAPLCGVGRKASKWIALRRQDLAMLSGGYGP